MSNTNIIGFVETDGIYGVLLDRWGSQVMVNVPKEVLNTFRKAVDTLPKHPPKPTEAPK